MTTRPHGTVDYAFETSLTNLATNTTLGTATRLDFAAITLALRETGITFDSVSLEVSYRSVFTAGATNVNGTRIGIKLGAVAFSDVDYESASPIANNGTEICFLQVRDVTSYFTTNWSGPTMTCQVGFACRTVAASNVNNISALLRIQYRCSDASTTMTKTVWIPIQSGLSTLTNAQVEFGTSGNSAAPANQIPQLSTFLPEASVSIEQASIEFIGNDGRNNTTDFNLEYQIDAAAAVPRATLEANLPGGVWFRDITIYDTATFATSSAHALKARASTTARFSCLGALLRVTYSYDPAATTTVLNSLLIPVDSLTLPYAASGTATADQDQQQIELWVQEPGSIALVQSGLILWNVVATNSGTIALVVSAGGQAERTYAGWPSQEWTGECCFVHRCDQGTSPWSLARGLNTLKWQCYETTAEQIGVAGGFAVVNYTSSVAAQGPLAHNQSMCTAGFDFATTFNAAGIRTVAAGSQKFPNFGAVPWFLQNASIEKFIIPNPRSQASPLAQLHQLEWQTGETQTDGWLSINKTLLGPLFMDMSNYNLTANLTSQCNRTNAQTGKLGVTTSRATRHRTDTIGGNGACTAYRWWTTISQITYTVSGTITGYSGDGSGLSVDVFSTYQDTYITTVTSAIGGTYTATVYDNTNAHFVVVRQDSTRVGRSDNTTPT